jgi:hypothetical protein
MPDRQSDTMMKILELVDKAMSILLAVDLNFWIRNAEGKRSRPISGVDPGGVTAVRIK